ncbi:beta-lactoglobulin I [Burkholderia semiarida]|nr:beta-lactoglobulin I [Burkholderia semiarida]
MFTSDGTLLATISTPTPPTLEQMADYCAEINGFADRDEWMYEARIDDIAYAPVH